MSKDKETSGAWPAVAGLVWLCLAVAVAATVYVLMEEPEIMKEHGRTKFWEVPLVHYRWAALAASLLAGLVGSGCVVWRGGGPGLFGMATLLNVILACFWALRFLLS